LRYALDSSKIKKKLGWQPKVSFEDGLRRTVEWYLNHQDWVEKVISDMQSITRKYMAARHK